MKKACISANKDIRKYFKSDNYKYEIKYDKDLLRRLSASISTKLVNTMDGILIASIMEEYRRDAWIEIVERCQDTGVDAFELNFSCPHGLPERQMGAAILHLRNPSIWILWVLPIAVGALLRSLLVDLRSVPAGGCLDS